MVDALRVSSQSHPRKLSGAIAGMVCDHQSAEIQPVGAGAVNQAVKAIALANRYLQEDEICIAFTVSTITIEMAAKPVTGIRFVIEPCPLNII